jgi:tetratricopeptide (TPR) repeat protein
MRALEADLENFNAALDADATGVTPDDRLRLTLAMQRFLYVRGHFHEARRRLDAALRHAPDADASLRWQAHNALGLTAFGLEAYAEAEASYRRALEIIVQTGDEAHAAMLWDNLGVVCTDQGRYEEAHAAYVTSLGINERLGDRDATLRVKLNYAYHHLHRRLYDRAEELCNECLVGFRANGDSKREAVALHDLGEIAFYRSRFAEARPFFVQSIRLKDALGDRRGISLTVYMYGLVMLREGYPEHAATLLAKSLAIRAELGIQSLPMPRPEHEAALAELAGALGAERFAAAWNRGRELFDEEAVQTVTTTGDDPTRDPARKKSR